MGCMAEAGGVVADKIIITRRDRTKGERHFGVMSQPPAWRDDRRERHRGEQQHERQDQNRMRSRHRKIFADARGRVNGNRQWAGMEAFTNLGAFEAFRLLL